MTSDNITIEPITEADVDAVMEIELASSPSPWPRRAFVEEMAREHAHTDLLRCNNALAAFINYWVVRDEVHIHNVATHPARRRQGYATRLLEHVLALARHAQARFVTLEVRRSNLDAQRLYRKHGFRQVGVRARYYVNNDEDALVMLLELPDAELSSRSPT